MRALAVQTATMVRRSFVNIIRVPAGLVTGMIFPVLFMFVTTAGVSRAADIPGFQADAYLDFYLAGALVQGALFAGIVAGTNIALDIELGFVKRLLMTPMRRTALMVGHVSGSVFLGMLQCTVIIIAASIAGARLRTGWPGYFAIVALCFLVTLTFTSIGAFIGARSGSSETTQTAFPFFFVLLNFSSFFLPREFSSGWFRTVATWNPVTYIIEGVRSVVISSWDWERIGYGLIAMGAISTIGFLAAGLSLRGALART